MLQAFHISADPETPVILDYLDYMVIVKMQDKIFHWKRHIVQLLFANERIDVEDVRETSKVNVPGVHETTVVCSKAQGNDTAVMCSEIPSNVIPDVETSQSAKPESVSANVNNEGEKRYPTRQRKPPEYLKEYKT